MKKIEAIIRKTKFEDVKEALLEAEIEWLNAVKLEDVDAVGLVQGRLIEMVCAADVAEKAVGVTVEDIRGSCPQHMIMLAIFGDTASVEAALEEIRRREKEGAEEW